MTDRHFWLAAIHWHGIGPIKLNVLLNYFKDIKKVFAATTEELMQLGFTAKEINTIQHPNWAQVEKDLTWLRAPDHFMMTQDHPHYPSSLKELNDAPHVLFVHGDLTVLNTQQLAIVGSRNPTPRGHENAYHFAYHLSKAGLTITSGLALGVDGASHQGAVAAAGPTIAVFGTGLAHIYPSRHQTLAQQITAGGALVSEFPPFTPPLAQNFPRRNRIISGMSLGVLVIEAALKSGSLITARFASEQGREVFAIPGSIHNALTRGCHYLIKQGAKLVEAVDDIFAELNISSTNQVEVEPSSAVNLSPAQAALLAKIDYEVTSLETIIARCGLTAAQVSSMLSLLELQNCVQFGGGGYARIR